MRRIVRLLHLAGIALAFSATVVAGPPAGTYRVYPLPVASPDHGSRMLLANPHDTGASPFGWHDTNGIFGADYTTLRGNNAWVYVDASPADNLPDGPGPDAGSGLVFDFSADPDVNPPAAYADALATNVFYLVNSFHDILWQHGFQEADGNFQENNYGHGGPAGDPVKVEILDGSGTNNANVITANDGTSPTIQLYIWDIASPDRGASFAADVVAYTYMQLVQDRLLRSSCNDNQDRPSRGYSDYLGVLLTNDFAGTTPQTPRGLGTWLMNQPLTGSGVRTHPYSTDMSVNPLTYIDSATAAGAVGMGPIYASALWDLTWRMVERDGASGDWSAGDGGDNRALRLVIHALKLQPCQAGLLQARDTLLQADLDLYAGRYVCDIWSAFARRGMGASARQGSTESVLDNVAAFDLPASCRGTIFADGFDPALVFEQFCSAPATINLPGAGTSGPASVYPLPITVSGLGAPIDAMRVRVFGLTHGFPADLDFLLVGPGGQALVMQSDAGGAADVSNLIYVIDDSALQTLATEVLASGTYRPGNNGATSDAFVAPAPAGPYNQPTSVGTATLQSTFGGTNPDGTWNLYIVDDFNVDSGSLGGVCIEIADTP